MKDGNFNDCIKAVKQRIDIIEVINSRISLDRHNKALCPFHEEKSPSFTVNQKGQYFHCFGCGVGGDVFRFLELIEKKPFKQVLRELSVRVGVELPDFDNTAIESINENNRIANILGATASFYHRNLDQEAREYLGKRGFSGETISRFQIGFANGGLRDHLKKVCGFPLDLCLQAGVLKRDGEKINDHFFHRIIFPNIVRGQVVHLTGRTIENGNPKYLHLPGKINHLYNEDALLNPEVLICEGIPDCLSDPSRVYCSCGLWHKSVQRATQRTI
jgi:DNA primase